MNVHRHEYWHAHRHTKLHEAYTIGTQTGTQSCFEACIQARVLEYDYKQYLYLGLVAKSKSKGELDTNNGHVVLFSIKLEMTGGVTSFKVSK